MPTISMLSLAAAGDSPLELILGASGVVMVVIGLLVLMSVLCWYIIGFKYLQLARARRESESFAEAFWQSKDIDAIYEQARTVATSPLAAMFLAGYSELGKVQRSKGAGQDRDGDLESVESGGGGGGGRGDPTPDKAKVKQITRLEAMTPFLATTGSAAPFIGLFGTVWGIMNSFRSIVAMKSASVQTVAPGIAEALIVTAMGLAAAIPAVMAYNFFARRIRVVASDMETFSKDFLNIVRRHFLK
jgi:biopolymer transport protein TolQ